MRLEVCKEMKKLRGELNKRSIKWWDASQQGRVPIIRTHFQFDNILISVVNGCGTYGGYTTDIEKNKGLLEVMIGLDEPEGYLTADRAIKYIEKVLGCKLRK